VAGGQWQVKRMSDRRRIDEPRSVFLAIHRSSFLVHQFSSHLPLANIRWPPILLIQAVPKIVIVQV
jgi:hypothetical protein